MSEDRFLDWAETQEGRFELVEGTVVMQAGATRDHERVAKRIFLSLYAQADEAVFDVNKGDFGVRITRGSGKGSILYPDVVVDRQSATGAERATTTPVAVVEVLSRSTDYADHVAKLKKYQVRETLRVYAVFEQTAPKAYLWVKEEAGWPEEPRIYEGLDQAVPFEAVRASVRLAEIYRAPDLTR
jgi:Uma2 family endonuclease